MSARRVLVTGINGFIGRHVATALRARGFTVIGTGRRVDVLADVDEMITAELFDPAQVSELAERAKAQVLLHLAWCTTHGSYRDSPDNVRWEDATVALARRFVAAGGQHIICAGSCIEYIWDERVCDEGDDALSDVHPYERHKAATRTRLAALCEAGNVAFAWARPFFLYGTGEDRRRLVPSVIDALLGQRPPFALQVQARRDYLHVHDVAAALAVLVERRARGTFNVCSGQPVALGDIVRVAAQALDVDPEPLLSNPVPPSPACITGHNAGLRALGWQPQVRLPVGIAALAAGAGAPRVNA